ncbi:ABC transporter permease [Paenibacillus caui]|uniref:ABC transporter permease n=1 Tax=Paenibacillus caui TaxID=2873927 RepID=UPI001CA98C9C|nr:ABC transporter permease [Paenibacillus caui]
MHLLAEAYAYAQENSEKVLEALRVHLTLSVTALLIASLVCIPLGYLCSRNEKLSPFIMNTFNTLRVIPSLAVLIVLLPIMGTGIAPAMVALTVLACPPILINTFSAFRSIDASIIEAARGVGMSAGQMLRSIELPLAAPLIMTGVKTAGVEVVASATLAAFIGGGGLGTFIINGLSMYDFSIMLVGAIQVAVIALVFEVFFSGLGKMAARLRDR